MNKLCTKCGKREVTFPWDDQCSACREKTYQQNLAQTIQDGEADCTDYEQDIFCPYCGEVYEIVDNDELYVEGGYECACAECDQAFHVDVHVSYSYSTQQIPPENKAGGHNADV